MKQQQEVWVCLSFWAAVGVDLEHGALQRNPCEVDFPVGLSARGCSVPWGDAGWTARCHRRSPPVGSACRKGSRPKQRPQSVPAGRPTCRHLPSHAVQKPRGAKSQQNHESKTTEPQSTSESLSRPPPPRGSQNSPPPAPPAARGHLGAGGIARGQTPLPMRAGHRQPPTP